MALAVVPSTLVRPQLPYLQGLLLFGLLAAFMWGERVRRPAAASAVAVLAVAGVVAAIAAPRIDPRHPWLNYRAWTTSAAATAKIDRFDWNQTYGPLRWPHNGHEVMVILARTADYWKAEDLDRFDGFGWAPGAAPPAPLPVVTAAQAAAWTQILRVDIESMSTRDVIAAGYAASPPTFPGGAVPGSGAGTWVARRELGPGTVYTVRVYSPHPTGAQLAADTIRYPRAGLAAYRTMALPQVASRRLPIQCSPSRPSMPGRRSAAARGWRAVHPQERSAPRPTARCTCSPTNWRSRPEPRTPSRLPSSASSAGASPTTRIRRPAPTRSSASCCTTGSVTASSSPAQWHCCCGWGAFPPAWPPGSPRSQERHHRRVTVSDIDAHAWVEAWFPHYGWVRFDPTPPTAPARGGGRRGDERTAAGKPLSGLGATAAARHREIGSAGVRAGAHRRGAGGGGGPSVVEVLGALALIAVVAGALRLALLRSRGDGDLLSELERALARTRRPLAGGVTLSELEHRLAATPEAAAYVRTLRQARYGGSADAPTAGQRRALRRELGRGLGIGRRSARAVGAAAADIRARVTHRRRRQSAAARSLD